LNNWKEELNKYVGHFQIFPPKTHDELANTSKILYSDTDLGRGVGFNRIAIHHVQIPAGFRSSYPHAESEEEEFVYVIKGQVDLWMNGYIYNLLEGHAVGFPAGTGVAHSFINNSSSEVKLLVVGEKTKSNNFCSFPINPELKSKSPIWWENPPLQKLGPHNGKPGLVTPSDKTSQTSSLITYCPENMGGRPFHYPGNNETFGEGFRLTDSLNLKALGIWYEILPPGRRSSFPHAHTHEEEFVYVLKGELTVWLNGYTKTIGPHCLAAFPSGTGLAHTLINNSDEDVVYICIGETEQFKDEKIIYPLNPLRNKECQRKGHLWETLPKQILGEMSAEPDNPIPDLVSFRLYQPKDDSIVLDIFNKSPAYFLNINGQLPSLKTVKSEVEGPPKKTHVDYFKEFLIIECNRNPIGALDLHVHHPDKGTCYLGLLLLIEEQQKKGFGKICYRLAEDYIKRALSCKKIRLGVSEAQDTSKFWLDLGFKFNNKTYTWKGENKISEVREFEKEL